MANSISGGELEELKIHHIDSKGNIYPVKLVINKEYYQLQFEKIDSSHSTSSRDRPSGVSRTSTSFNSHKKIICSSYPEVIPFSQIKDIYWVNFEPKFVNERALKELKSWNHGFRQSNKFKVFCILYGKEFNLKKHAFLVAELDAHGHIQNQGVLEAWISNTTAFISSISLSYFKRLELWHRKEFVKTTRRCTDYLRLKIWKQFLYRGHHRITTQDLLDLLPEQYNSRDMGSLEQGEFETMSRHLLHSSQSIAAIFDCFTSESAASFLDSNEWVPPYSEFLEMFRKYFTYLGLHGQSLPNIGQVLDEASLLTKTIIRKATEQLSDCSDSYSVCIDENWMCTYYLLDYMFSDDNSIWNPEYDKIYQDMDRPLSHYWIASSHNTYLTGDQYSSQSSADAYARVLRQGCRCIEIDVWNGNWNKPIIKHGMTLTTSVRLKEVLIAIRDNAFIASSYPVIISVENHCNLKQQKVMAKYFRKIFGRMLVTSPITDATSLDGSVPVISQLPSPNQLQNKIIIKGRKLPSELFDSAAEPTEPEPVDETSSEFTIAPTPRLPLPCTSNDDLCSTASFEESPCDCLNTGELWKSNNKGEWIPYIFVLTNEKLFYVEKRVHEEEIRTSRYFGSRRDAFRYSMASLESNQDLHMDQPWFHGKIPGGRVAAAALLENRGTEGCFLVRESDTQANGFTLSFVCNEKVYHCHIYNHVTNNNERMFSLKKDPKKEESFTSAYELVEHYKNHSINTNECALQGLVEPVPPSKTHESQEWFYYEMDRNGAEKVLERLPINGAFIARYGTDDRSTIVISIRYENVIKHCRINVEGRYLTVSNMKFTKLETLVEHYGRNNFYKDIKLSHPVGNELYRQSQQSDCVQRVYACAAYINSTVKTVKGRARAIQSYKTDDPTLLSYSKGDVIINVIKEPDGWWWGTLPFGCETPKLFCSSFVEELEELDCPIGETCRGVFKIEKSVKVKSCCDKPGKDKGIKHYLIFKDHDGTKRKLGASCSKRKVNEWADLINHVIGKDTVGRMKWAKIQAAEKHNIASEYSDLIIYCCGMERLNPEEIGMNKDKINVTAIKSLDEIRGDRLLRFRSSYFVWYHQYAMTRVYPKGLRLDSSNLSPARFWNFGCQMVALNYQTSDKPMQWNRGRFRQNGNCGYVLKPDFMISETQNNHDFQFDPTRLQREDSWKEEYLLIQVISARHLDKDGSGSVSPLVEVEIIGVDADCRKFKTTIDEDNGLNPFWNCSFNVPLHCPELALVQFSVCDVDTFSDRVLLGEATIPVTCMREGVRSVQLNNAYGEPLFSTLLVKVTRSDSM